MILIPVIDLLHGQVVRAVRGDRKAYRPIESPLCGSSDPATVARILCDHCASPQLYVADLDALQRGPVQADVLERLLLAMPGTELWLDAGFASPDDAAVLRCRLGALAGRLVVVYGSESLASREVLERCFSTGTGTGAGTGDGADRNAILSLDRRDGQKLDAAGCWELPAVWPQRVIVMTLERVGADAGPDLETLADVQRRAPQARLIGAGGIRNDDDLRRADAAGAHAWLVASALHDKRLARVGR